MQFHKKKTFWFIWFHEFFCFVFLPRLLGFGSVVCKTSWTQLFFNFFAKFLAYLMTFQCRVLRWRRCETLKNLQIWQKFGKKIQKSRVQLALSTFFGWIKHRWRKYNFGGSFFCLLGLYISNLFEKSQFVIRLCRDNYISMYSFLDCCKKRPNKFALKIGIK